MYGEGAGREFGVTLKRFFRSSRPAQFQGLQFLRANAVLLVVLCHSAAVLGLPAFFDRTLLDGLFNKGAVGVDLFFVLSGFIIIHVSVREITLEPNVEIGRFLQKRFIRIVPLLWVAVGLYALVRYLGTREFEIWPYVNAFFLIPLGEVRPNVVWSLRHEALFYIVFAISFLLRRRMRFLLYVWCFAPVGIWLLEVSQWSVGSNGLADFVFNRANALFGCGVLVGLICKRYGFLSAPLGGRAIFAWAALIGVTAVAFLVRDFLTTGVVAVVASLALIVGLMTPNDSSRFARFWEMLGNASYSIYLTHNIFLLVGATAWMKVFGNLGFAFAVAVLGVVAVGGGVLFHFLVERPLLQFVTRLLSGRTRLATVG